MVSNDHSNSQVYLENIIERIPYYIFWKNTELVYLGCNQRFADLVGKQSPKAIIGKTDFDLGWGDGEPELFREGDQEVMRGNPKINVEETLIRPDGSRIVMLVNKLPLRDKYGNCIGILGTSTDITARKKLEEELNVAKEKAETMNRVKTEFLANMSHDIKTPLAGIVGNAELLLRKSGNQMSNESLEEIMQCGQTLLCFFDNCLELSKLENADITLMHERFNMKALILEVISLFKPAAKSKGLTLDIHYDDQIPVYLLGNRPAFYRILQNLIGNAVKFTHEGYVHIHVALYKSLSPKKVMIQLIIEDTGIGIAYSKQSIIFENLRRLTPSHKGIYEGNGIGLYLVDKFVKAMSGQIYLESEENKGSKFILALPFQVPLIADDFIGNQVKKSAPLPTFQEIKVANDSALDTIDLPKSSTTRLISILLVEDNKMAQKMTQNLLESLGYCVEIADNGEEAIELLGQKQYDLVYMDIGLPGMDGCETTRQWRKKEYGLSSALPIIALTAHGSLNETAICFEAGINGVLKKPLLAKQAIQVADQFIYHKAIEVEEMLTPNSLIP